MGIFDFFKSTGKESNGPSHGAVDGPNKKGGGHDHRVNTGDDRTPAQKEGDKSRKKDTDTD